MSRKEFAGGAARLTLAANIDADDTTITTTGTVTGWPTGASYPFVAELERGVAGKAEKVLVTSRTGNTLNGVTRGYDGTTAVAHTAAATTYIEHVIDAGTIDEANAHANDDTRDDHSQYLNTTRHDVTARHLLGTSIASGVPGASAPDDTASEGASTAAARVDHRHAREAKGLVGDVASIEIGDAAVAGASGRVADAAHQHALGTPGTPIASNPGDTGGAGSSTTPARSDHVHGREGFGTPTGISFGGSNAAGSATTLARSDHVHALNPYPALTPFSTGAFGDISIAANTTSDLVSQAINPTAAKLIIIWGQIMTREATAGTLNFAGILGINVDGAVIETTRLHSHNLGGVVPGTIFAMGTVTAGAHTIKLTFNNDATSATAVLVSEMELNVYLLGG